MRFSRIARSLLLPFAALALVGSLAGCVAYPAYPGYGYGYAPAPAYAYAPVPAVTIGGGWGCCWGRGWHHW
jgi:hypothetical protein